MDEQKNERKQLTVSDHSSFERKKWVLQQYLKGRLPYDIRAEYVASTGLSEHSFDKDVLWVNTELRKHGERDIETIIQTHSDYLLDVYRECRENGDSSNAIKALKERRELLGVGGTKTKSISLNQTINNTIPLPDMSVDLIRELLGKTDSSTGTTIDINPE